MALLRAVADLLFPPLCQVCRQPGEYPLCRSCRRQFRLIDPPVCQKCGLPLRGPPDLRFTCIPCRSRRWPFTCARAAGIYEGALREAIHALKFGKRLSLVQPLAVCLSDAVLADPRLHPDLIIPVPLHATRRRERGFNQSALLAADLARRLAVPVDGDRLRRLRPTASQTELTAADRRANVRDAFRAMPGPAVGRVLVVDDVMSTGATVGECARALRQAGAVEVMVITLARALPQGS